MIESVGIDDRGCWYWWSRLLVLMIKAWYWWSRLGIDDRGCWYWWSRLLVLMIEAVGIDDRGCWLLTKGAIFIHMQLHIYTKFVWSPSVSKPFFLALFFLALPSFSLSLLLSLSLHASVCLSLSLSMCLSIYSCLSLIVSVSLSVMYP